MKYLMLALFVSLIVGVGCKTAHHGTVQNRSSQTLFVSCMSTTGDCTWGAEFFEPTFRNTSSELSPGNAAVFDIREGDVASDGRPWRSCIWVSLNGRTGWVVAEVGDRSLMAMVDDQGELALVESPQAREERVVNWLLVLVVGGVLVQGGFLVNHVKRRRAEKSLQETTP